MHAYLARMAQLRTIGMGALYFFTSHMVIRSMFYVGVGRSTPQIVIFFLLLLTAVAIVHAAPHVFLDLRARASVYIRMPLVSALAALGSFLLVLSILPEMGAVPLYLGGALAGLACGGAPVSPPGQALARFRQEQMRDSSPFAPTPQTGR